jgi:hypothetical protein
MPKRLKTTKQLITLEEARSKQKESGSGDVERRRQHRSNRAVARRRSGGVVHCSKEGRKRQPDSAGAGTAVWASGESRSGKLACRRGRVGTAARSWLRAKGGEQGALRAREAEPGSFFVFLREMNLVRLSEPATTGWPPSWARHGLRPGPKVFSDLVDQNCSRLIRKSGNSYTPTRSTRTARHTIPRACRPAQ